MTKNITSSQRSFVVLSRFAALRDSNLAVGVFLVVFCFVLFCFFFIGMIYFFSITGRLHSRDLRSAQACAMGKRTRWLSRLGVQRLAKRQVLIFSAAARVCHQLRKSMRSWTKRAAWRSARSVALHACSRQSKSVNSPNRTFLYKCYQMEPFCHTLSVNWYFIFPFRNMLIWWFWVRLEAFIALKLRK